MSQFFCIMVEVKIILGVYSSEFTWEDILDLENKFAEWIEDRKQLAYLYAEYKLTAVEDAFSFMLKKTNWLIKIENSLFVSWKHLVCWLLHIKYERVQ